MKCHQYSLGPISHAQINPERAEQGAAVGQTFGSGAQEGARCSPGQGAAQGSSPHDSCLMAKKKILKAANPYPEAGSCCLLLSGPEGSSAWPDKNPWTQLWLPSGCSLQEQTDFSS